MAPLSWVVIATIILLSFFKDQHLNCIVLVSDLYGCSKIIRGPKMLASSFTTWGYIETRPSSVLPSQFQPAPLYSQLFQSCPIPLYLQLYLCTSVLACSSPLQFHFPPEYKHTDLSCSILHCPSLGPPLKRNSQSCQARQWFWGPPNSFHWWPTRSSTH